MSYALTDNQARQLGVFFRHGAVSYETSIGPWDGPEFSNMVLGRLLAMGLAANKVVKSGAFRPGKGPTGGQQTVYWLTAEGVALAERLAS